MQPVTFIEFFFLHPVIRSCTVVPGLISKVIIRYEVKVMPNSACKEVKLVTGSKLTLQVGKNLNKVA